MVPSSHDLEPCPYGCGEEVLVTITEHGRRLPVNPGPDPAGNQAVWCAGTGTWRSRALNGRDAMRLLGYEDPFVPHVATSPTCTPRPRQTPLPGLTIPSARRRIGRLPRPYRRT
ncbi:hypothetical protein ACGFIV_00830 [Sphaerisporangium sp. NPDC049003]|uniref:hypothetical protein n=1 Tax=Sphaerisporangium sp. NPDC049003 TaxID=3364517 RepID=UPI003711FFDE